MPPIKKPLQIHTVRIEFDDRTAAEAAFERLEHMLWIMEEGGTLILSSEEVGTDDAAN